MAVTIQADALATELNIPPTTAARLLPVATEMVTRYAPQAPDAMANEGVIRLAGYMASTSHYGAIRSSEVGPAQSRKRSQPRHDVSQQWGASLVDPIQG